MSLTGDAGGQMVDSTPFSGAILAGGRARRFGHIDKSALIVDGASILHRQIAALRAITPHILIIGANAPRNQVPAVRWVADRMPGAGPLNGVYTALCEAPTERVLVIACDMPFVTASFLAHLAVLGAAGPVVIPRTATGWHPLCGCYARAIAPHLKACLDQGRYGVISALERLPVREVSAAEVARFDPAGLLLLNVNTPDDYARARAAEGSLESSERALDQPGAIDPPAPVTT